MAGLSSSGWLSNLPLATKSKDLLDKTKENGQVLAQKLLPDGEVEVNDQGDEWYDTDSSSEDSLSPMKSMSADVYHSHVTDKSITPEEKAALLPHMPSLFGVDLPPCNAEIQVAYENVVTILRSRWLAQRGRIASIDLCNSVKTDLINQNFMYPAFSIKGKYKKRKPWRRENVFKYELRWIEYFVREAQAQCPDLMTESEIMERRKEASAPGVLGFNLADWPDVRNLWDEWHMKKRAKTLAMPERPDTPLADDSSKEDVLEEAKTNSDVKESLPSSTGSDTTTVQPMAA